MIESSDGTTLYTKEVDLQTGVNVIPYDMSFDGRFAEMMEESLNKDRKPDTKPISVKAAKNGTYYLRPGKYTAVLEVNGTEAKAGFEVR